MKRLRSHPTFLNARAALAALSGNCDQGDGKLRRVEKARVDDDNEQLIARVSAKLGVTVEDFMSANAYALDLRRRFDAHRLAKNAKNRRKKWKREPRQKRQIQVAECPWKQELAANEAHYIAMTAEEAAAALGVPRSTLSDHWHSLERGRWPRGR